MLASWNGAVVRGRLGWCREGMETQEEETGPAVDPDPGWPQDLSLLPDLRGFGTLLGISWVDSTHLFQLSDPWGIISINDNHLRLLCKRAVLCPVLDSIMLSKNEIP